MSIIHAWAAHAPGQELVPFEYDAGELDPEEVEIAVEYCGLCHSDLSVLNNEWGISSYPFVPGHEVIGRVVALGAQVKELSIGQRVGIGWIVGSCEHCRFCLDGAPHLCSGVKPTILDGHYGGFADRVRTRWSWAIPLPEALDPRSAGPLLCAGTAVFAPLAIFDIKPTQHVGVVGIGGLGHLALQFAKAWGCEVTAFTSSEGKFEDAKALGAHHVVSSRDVNAHRAMANSIDCLLVTVNVAELDWSSLISTLAPRGRLHFLGVIQEPITFVPFDLFLTQRSISSSADGSPTMMAQVLQFAARHNIVPCAEHFPMSGVNEAMELLRSGSVRYRIILDMDGQAFS